MPLSWGYKHVIKWGRMGNSKVVHIMQYSYYMYMYSVNPMPIAALYPKIIKSMRVGKNFETTKKQSHYNIWSTNRRDEDCKKPKERRRLLFECWKAELNDRCLLWHAIHSYT